MPNAMGIRVGLIEAGVIIEAVVIETGPAEGSDRCIVSSQSAAFCLGSVSRSLSEVMKFLKGVSKPT